MRGGSIRRDKYTLFTDERRCVVWGSERSVRGRGLRHRRLTPAPPPHATVFDFVFLIATFLYCEFCLSLSIESRLVSTTTSHSLATPHRTRTRRASRESSAETRERDLSSSELSPHRSTHTPTSSGLVTGVVAGSRPRGSRPREPPSGAALYTSGAALGGVAHTLMALTPAPLAPLTSAAPPAPPPPAWGPRP